MIFCFSKVGKKNETYGALLVPDTGRTGLCAGFCGCEPPDSRAQLWAFLVAEVVLGLFRGARLGNPNTYSRVFPGPRVIRQGLWVGQMLPTLARVFSALLVASMPGILSKHMPLLFYLSPQL